MGQKFLPNVMGITKRERNLLGEKTQFPGSGKGFGSSTNAEFAIKIAYVSFYRGGRYAHVHGNVFVCVARIDSFKHF